MADLLAMWLGYVSPNTGAMILSFLGFGTVAAFRSALKSETDRLIEGVAKHVIHSGK